MSYTLTKEAATDLREIAQYTVEHFGKKQANAYGDNLSVSFSRLVDNPYLGRDFGYIRAGLRRHTHESHGIYYLVHDQGLLIVRVLHYSQDVKKGLNKGIPAVYSNKF